jgi:uncharacterized protein with PQ loop repeat
MGRDALSLSQAIDQLQEHAARYSIVLAAFGLLLFFGDMLLRASNVIAFVVALVTTLFYLPSLARSIREARAKKLGSARNDLVQYERQSRILYSTVLFAMGSLRISLLLATTAAMLASNTIGHLLAGATWIASFLLLWALFPRREAFLAPCPRCGVSRPALINIRFCASCPFGQQRHGNQTPLTSLGRGEILSDAQLDKLVRIIRKKEDSPDN